MFLKRILPSSFSSGVALLLTTVLTASGTTHAKQRNASDDIVYIKGLDQAPPGSVWDGGEGIDTLVLHDVSLREVVANGARVAGFERIQANYTSPVDRDGLKLGAETFRYGYRNDSFTGNYVFTVEVLDSVERSVAKLEIDVSALGSEYEASQVRVTTRGEQGMRRVENGSVQRDSLTTNRVLTDVLEWMLEDQGFIRPLPPGEEDPQALLACFVFPVGSTACLVGVAITIAATCCTNPGTGGPGA